jgi:PAS domain S-box-containing protein
LAKTQIIKAPQVSVSVKAEADAIFISMGDGAITTDEFGRITRVNPAARKMLGFKESELLNKPFLKTIIALDLDGQKMTVIDRPITRAFLTGETVKRKMLIQTKRGKNIPVAVSVSPLMINKRPIGAIELMRDISIEMEVDRMKSEFISLASHQLRTPLSAIKTYTHMLKDEYMGGLNDEQKESLETIISASNRMNELISTLLNITRIESGTIAVNPKNVKIDDLVKEVMPELILMAEDKDITLSTRTVGKASTKLKTDGLIVKEIITNLVSNALKYTPKKGQVRIIIKPRRSDILVEVNDSGWGIPNQLQDKVFSKFFRASNIIKRETSGTGLGLYLVHGLLETLNGKIWFKSEEGKGTSFFFSLPRTYRKNKSVNNFNG